MKRKEDSSKASRNKTQPPKKTNIKPKPKSKGKQIKKQEQTVFVMIDNNFYIADTRTDRWKYEQFENRVKTSGSIIKKSRNKSNYFQQPAEHSETHMKEYLRGLSKSQKEQLMKDLTQELAHHNSNQTIGEPGAKIESANINSLDYVHQSSQERQMGYDRSIEQSRMVKQDRYMGQDRLGRLADNMEQVQREIVSQCEGEIARVTNMFDNEQISLQEKNSKITIVEKIKQRKLGMLSRIEGIFKQILDQGTTQGDREDQIESILNSLNQHSEQSRNSNQHTHNINQHSNQSIDSNHDEYTNNKQKGYSSKSDYNKYNQDSRIYHNRKSGDHHMNNRGTKSDTNYNHGYNNKIQDNQSRNNQIQQNKLSTGQNHQLQNSQHIQPYSHQKDQQHTHQKQQNIEHNQQQLQISQKQKDQQVKVELVKDQQGFQRFNLKLDIRVDEVQFGKPYIPPVEYSPTLNQHEQNQSKINQNQSNMREKQAKLETISFKQQPIVQPFKKQTILQPSKHQSSIQICKQQIIVQPQREQSKEQFVCTQKNNDFQISIPLLMTKDRLQQMHLEKVNAQKEALAVSLKNRMAVQLSQISDNQQCFTTLVGVNTFIMGFYEFLMRSLMNQVISGMNIPYGKSCLDKLYLLEHEGYVPDSDYHRVLPDQFLSKYHQELALAQRRIPQLEKVHNKAIFHCFNAGINVYRPYYQLEGQIFPWTTSEKGLTFYEINQDNIEEVFEKSKMKALQSCASLCGIMPAVQLTTPEARKELQKRNEDTYERILKTQTNENYGDWGIKMVNIQAKTRLLVSQEIIQAQFLSFIQELLVLTNK